MALSKPSSNNQSSTREFKQRVLTCLNKLSDRDTHSAAASELESIAKTINHELISSFLSSITATDSSDKSPVRKQCVRLISTLSEAHGDALSSHLSKLVSAVVRRLRDPDHSVRSACVAATGSIATHVTKPPFTSVAKPLVDALVTEQDMNSQIGAALCLASAVDGAPDPEPVYLRRIIARIEKLLKCDSFKAKAALLTVLGSLIGVGAASNPMIVKNLVNVLVEFVAKSEDWSSRKSAAEALEKLAIVESALLSEFKVPCLKTFDAKKFDKVKIVRETMNQMIEAWKSIPDVPEEELTPSESHSSSKAAKVASDINPPRTPPKTNKKTSSTGVSTATRRISLENNKKTSPAMFRKLDRKKHPTHSASQSSVNNNHIHEKSVIFNQIVEEEVHESEFHNAKLNPNVVESNITEDNQNIHKNHKDSEELALIRNHLIQIETQQSNLFDLIEKFTKNSETGMRSLETRVHGLELTLDEISFDLARSTGRLSNPNSTQTLCCKLPVAGLLSSKLWKKTETQHSNIISFSKSQFTATGRMTEKNMNYESCNPNNKGFRHQEGGSGLIKNPLAVAHMNNHGIL